MSCRCCSLNVTMPTDGRFGDAWTRSWTYFTISTASWGLVFGARDDPVAKIHLRSACPQVHALVTVLRPANGVELQACFRGQQGGRRETTQVAAIVGAVAEGDQRLVLAAVVPVQAQRRHPCQLAFAEDGLLVLDDLLNVRVVDLLVIDCAATDLASRRHLLAVANNDGRASPPKGAYCLRNGDLGGLIKDDDVKLHDAGFDEVDHGGRDCTGRAV